MKSLNDVVEVALSNGFDVGKHSHYHVQDNEVTFYYGSNSHFRHFTLSDLIFSHSFAKAFFKDELSAYPSQAHRDLFYILSHLVMEESDQQRLDYLIDHLKEITE